MTQRIVLQPQAEVDIDDAAAWYESERAGLGTEFVEDLSVLLERIESNPQQFPIVHEQTRRGMLTRFPYGAFFVVREDTVVVLAVVHLHRHPDTWKRRGSLG